MSYIVSGPQAILPALTVLNDLTVNGAATIAGDFAVNTDTLFVDTALGFIGINRSVPSAMIHGRIPGTGSKELLRLETEGTGTTRVLIQTDGTDDTQMSLRNSVGSEVISFRTDASPSFISGGGGNFGLGTAGPGGSGTLGTHVFSIRNGTPPVGGVGNVSSIYSDDVSASSELFAINEAGELTQITGRTSAYTPTNVVTDRSYDADATTTEELADVLGTLIADLQARGIVG